MAIGPGRGFLTGALLVIFILLSLSAWRFMTSEESLEGFQSAYSAPPTRAADCQCLPGYIPSNQINKVEMVGIETAPVYGIIKNGGLYIWYGDYNNIPPPKNTISVREAFSYTWMGPTTSKELFDEAINSFSSEGSNYFCQSLNNPRETRKCY